MQTDPLDFLWKRLDPLLTQIGLTKTKLLSLLIIIGSALAVKGYLPEEVVAWLEQYAAYVAAATYGAMNYFQRIGTEKVDAKVEEVIKGSPYVRQTR